MSSGPPNGARSKTRKGKRALAEVEPSTDVVEPASKRIVGENDVKLEEEEEEEKPRTRRRKEKNEIEENTPMEVDHEVPKGLKGILASSSNGEEVKSAVKGGKKVTGAKRVYTRRNSSNLAQKLPEHWIFDEKNVPQDVLIWVLDWFSRQECCVLRAVCHKWSDIVGLRVLTQTTSMHLGNAFLRIPGSRFLGHRDFPWSKSKLAEKIESLNLTPNTESGVIFATTVTGIPNLKPFKNLRHLAVNAIDDVLERLVGANLNLDTLTLLAPTTTAMLPLAWKIDSKFSASRVQLTEYNSMTLSSLRQFLDLFPNLRHLALYKVGLSTPKTIATWIATTYKSVLETLLIDLIPYTSTLKEQRVSLATLDPFFSMDQLRVLTIYANDYNFLDEESEHTIENCKTYFSKSLECLTIESPNVSRTPIKLEIPNLAELRASNLSYLDVAECPILETIALDCPFEHSAQFFKRYAGKMLRHLTLACSTRPRTLSKPTLKLSLPEARTLEINLGHDEVDAITVDALQLTHIKLLVHSHAPAATLKTPNLLNLSADGPPAFLEKIDQQLHMWPLLRKTTMVHHYSEPNRDPPYFRPADAHLDLLPSSHPSLGSLFLSSGHRTLATLKQFNMLRSLKVISQIYDVDLRFLLSGGAVLPNLMTLDLSADEPARLDEPLSTVALVALPSLYSLRLQLYRLPQLKFNGQRHLSSIHLIVRSEGIWYRSKSVSVQKVDWIRQLPGLETLILSSLNLPTTLTIKSPSLRVLQLLDTKTQQPTKLSIQCPNLRVLNLQSPSTIKSVEDIDLPSLEKLFITSDISRWKKELWSSVPPNTRPHNTDVALYSPPFRTVGGQIDIRGLANILGPLLPMFLQGGFGFGADEDGAEDDDLSDDDDHDEDGEICPNCGRVHGNRLYSPDDSDDDEDDDDDGDDDDDEGENDYGFGDEDMDSDDDSFLADVLHLL